MTETAIVLVQLMYASPGAQSWGGRKAANSSVLCDLLGCMLRRKGAVCKIEDSLLTIVCFMIAQ
jgi:hypothetical protein